MRVGRFDRAWRRLAIAAPLSLFVHFLVLMLTRPEYRPVADVAVDLDVIEAAPGPPPKAPAPEAAPPEPEPEPVAPPASEKIAIAERHVIPQKLAVTGLKAEEARLTKDAIRRIIEGYTMEAGVRKLRQQIESILRKISAWTETRGEKAPGVVDEQDLRRRARWRATAGLARSRAEGASRRAPPRDDRLRRA